MDNGLGYAGDTETKRYKGEDKKEGGYVDEISTKYKCGMNSEI